MTAHSLRSTSIRSGVTGVLVGVTVWGLLSLSGVTGAVQSAGAADGSAVTVRAADQDADIADAPFPDLTVTVSQTRDLIAQGIVVSWTGGAQSTPPNNQTGGENFLQIFQCWADDPSHPEEPDRTSCQYGATLGPGATRDAFREPGSVAPEDEAYTAPGDDFARPTYTSIPFRPASGGALVESVVGGAKTNTDVNTNPYFTQYTSNEVSWAGSGRDGSGSTKFEIQTGVQSRGLGCGTPVTGTDGTVTGSRCWLVVVPRGTADSGSPSITQSGLFWDAWKHRVAIRLDFKPTGSRCPIGAAERQVAGSELISTAVSSWQPALCGAQGGAVYSALTGAESDAALAANGTANAPMALTSRALGAEVDDQLRYAPIALTGLAISFAIDREPKADGSASDDEVERARLPFTSLKLTPRLVAKLLTDSYLDALPTSADRTHLSHLVGGVRVDNPRTLTSDPDFLEINDPAWAQQSLVGPSLADLLVPQGRSDAAWAIWSYLLADPDAAAFLAGTPDPWGMTVNPWSLPTAANPSGSPLELPRDDFPKADPVEQPSDGTIGPINLVTWRPYVNDFDTSAYLTLRGDGQLLGGWDPTSQPPKYGKAPRNLPGLQRVLGVTDTGSAARYQVFTAQLRNQAGQFVSPSDDSMLAAAAAMTRDPEQAQVLGYDPRSASAKAAASAYPLTLPVYAAVNPAVTDVAARTDYSAFIRFAATTGQTPGTADGQLPAGFAPIPQGWRDQALAAAAAILAGAAPAEQDNGSTTAGSGFGFGSATDLAGSGEIPGATNPDATGVVAAALFGAATPKDPDSGGLPATVPVSLLAGIASAIAVPLFTRRRALPAWRSR